MWNFEHVELYTMNQLNDDQYDFKIYRQFRKEMALFLTGKQLISVIF